MLLQFAFAGIIAFVGMLLFVYFWRLLALLGWQRLTGRSGLTRPWLDRLAARWAIFAGGILVISLFGYAWLVEPYRIEVSQEEIRTGDLPEGTRLRIVHLSDLHVDEEGPREKELPGLVQAAKPDIILLTGDYLTAATPEADAALVRLVESLDAPLGIYAVSGNWDVRQWSRARSLLRKSGVQVIDAYYEDFDFAGGHFRVLGGYDRDMLEETEPLDGFQIILHHTPDYIEEVAGKVDLYLCGHTHGGQVRLPFFGAVITLSKFWKRYEMGRYEVKGTTLYVHRGIGAEGGPVPRLRFLSPPEVAVIEVVGTGSAQQ